ncbi:hypothetical protein CEE45_03470 [Candidatus Heimdallarchaeota archaeon B3_Heim]|nr:MAG: hypothetical protein CEE45_03470 [Candidatus Heimdallarchaeota archaeon B3_Heim]
MPSKSYNDILLDCQEAFKGRFDQLIDSSMLFDRVSEHRYIDVDSKWFDPKVKPETVTSQFIEMLFNNLGIPSEELAREALLQRKRLSYEARDVIKWPDYLIKSGDEAGKGLLIEVEPIGRSLTDDPEHGLGQVARWFREFEGLYEDFHGIATNFVDWILYTKKSEGYGMIEQKLNPEVALELIYRTYHGKIPNYVVEQFEQQKQTIALFYDDYIELFDSIITDPERYFTNIHSKWTLEEKSKNLVSYYRTIFFRLLFVKVLKEWRLLPLDPVDTILMHEETFHHYLFQKLFFEVFNKEPEQRIDVLDEFEPLPYLNGGLFRKTQLERDFSLELASEVYKSIWQMLSKYSFS